MRILFLALFAGLSMTAFSQSSSGTYQNVAWSVNEHQALFWNGQPYTPVGTVLDGTPAAIEEAHSAGISDAVVDLPIGGAGWAPALDTLNKNGMRYLVRLSSLAPLADGIAVEPQSYRIAGLTNKRTVTLTLPGVRSVFAVLASARDGYVEKSERVRTPGGVFNYDVDVPSGLEYVLLLYPETEGLEMPDFWEGLDQARDELLTTLKRTKLGAGLRGIVNPLGRTLSLPGKQLNFVPTSPTFRLEFAALLEQRYRTIETTQRSWSMNASSFSTTTVTSKPLATFADLARLVPLWSDSRGVSFLWDPTTNKMYGCDNKHSTIWRDIVDTVAQAGVRRFERLVGAVRQVADVPVVQEWSGWAAPYEGNSSLTGIGMRASGSTPIAITDATSRAASSAFRWNKPCWLLATDINPLQDPSKLTGTLDDLLSQGAHALFIVAKTPDMLKAVAAENAKRSTNAAIATYSPTPVFFPENALNPAAPQPLPGGRWWLPSPADGDRIDLGPDFKAIRMRLGGVASFSIWARTSGRVLLRMVDPKSALFQTVDGSDPNPVLKKNGVEVTLTELPLIVTGTQEVPVPEPALAQVMNKFAELIKRANEVHMDATEERLAFQQSASSLANAPGTTFLIMMDEYYKAAQRLGAFTWLEAEKPVATNFSEAAKTPTCSTGGSLVLRTAIPPDGAYFAEYDVPVRSTELQQVWLAAKIPVEQRKNVQLLIGGQTLLLQEEPIGGYGDGYAWYHLGSTRLAGGQTRIRLSVVAPEGADLALDAIVLTPVAFVPNGVTPPDAVVLRR